MQNAPGSVYNGTGFGAMAIWGISRLAKWPIFSTREPVEKRPRKRAIQIWMRTWIPRLRGRGKRHNAWQAKVVSVCSPDLQAVQTQYTAGAVPAHRPPGRFDLGQVASLLLFLLAKEAGYQAGSTGDCPGAPLGSRWFRRSPTPRKAKAVTPNMGRRPIASANNPLNQGPTKMPAA